MMSREDLLLNQFVKWILEKLIFVGLTNRKYSEIEKCSKFVHLEEEKWMIIKKTVELWING